MNNLEISEDNERIMNELLEKGINNLKNSE